LIKTKDCFEKGLLKKDIPSLDLARKSLKQAEFFLGEAHDLLDINKKEIAVLSLYNAFFHVSRALLFKDGVKERSHYCVARYIDSVYVEKNKLNKKFLNAFESLMGLRKNIQYSTERTIVDDDLNEYYDICGEFISEVEVLIK